MSDGYLHKGKTIPCRVGDFFRFQYLDDINRPDVIVMVNPGGTNEKFVMNYEEIPSMIAEGVADVMFPG